MFWAPVVVNKTFLGQPQQSLVFPQNSTVPKNPPQTIQVPPKFTQIGFLKTRQIHQNSFGPVGFDERILWWGCLLGIGGDFCGK